MSSLASYMKNHEQDMVELLKELVEIESPSNEKGCVDVLSRRVGELLEKAGARVERIPVDSYGDMVMGTWGPANSGRPILIIGHLDTVWPVGTLKERPVQIKDGKLYGPGAYDMKAGVVIVLEAIRALTALNFDLSAPVTVLFNGDEEIGSKGSRETIERLAAKSRLVLCLEPALAGGALKTGRKGIGSFHVKVKGRAAHAGGDHSKGINAIEEMAHQVLKLQAMTDYERGTTVNIGLIKGGSAENVVPAECWVSVDLRLESLDAAGPVIQTIQSLTPILPGAEVEVVGGLDRPPMQRNELMIRTFNQAKEIARRHGIEIGEGSTGGGSDANFTANLGTPTLDGLGADGDGAHAITEHVLISSLPQRAALLAAILSEWPQSD